MTDWLTIGVNGDLTGTPSFAGTYRWTVRATAGGESVDAILEVTTTAGPPTVNLIADGDFDDLSPGMSDAVTPYVAGGWTFENFAGVNLDGTDVGAPPSYSDLYSFGPFQLDGLGERRLSFQLPPGVPVFGAWQGIILQPMGSSCDAAFSAAFAMSDW